MGKVLAILASDCTSQTRGLAIVNATTLGESTFHYVADDLVAAVGPEVCCMSCRR
jgi:hypothetical protein